MEDQLRPQMNWGAEARRFGEETGRQTFLCVSCIMAGNVSPPQQVVLLGGNSFCLPHSLLNVPPQPTRLIDD